MSFLSILLFASAFYFINAQDWSYWDLGKAAAGNAPIAAPIMDPPAYTEPLGGYMKEMRKAVDHMIPSQLDMSMQEQSKNKAMNDFARYITYLETAANDELVSLVTNYFKKPESDTNIILKYWAIKLDRLVPEQRRFAEKLINDVLFEGEMKTLTRNGVSFEETTTQYDESVSSVFNDNKRPKSDTNIVLNAWANKLNGLVPDQRRFAENIINDILFEGEMEHLKRDCIVFR